MGEAPDLVYICSWLIEHEYDMNAPELRLETHSHNIKQWHNSNITLGCYEIGGHDVSIVI